MDWATNPAPARGFVENSTLNVELVAIAWAISDLWLAHTRSFPRLTQSRQGEAIGTN